MKLQHIELENLKPCPINVRKHGGGNVDDLVTSIRRFGILQPLLVRKNCEGYEVVAGQRRLKAVQAICEQDNSELEPVPCAILEEDDDATAIEASLAENIARLPMDEIDQYEAFAALKKQGKTIDDIASDFGVTERLVKQRLAIANLHPPILNAYRKDEINGEIMRILTMATKRQQKQWLALFRDPEKHAPRGYQLKSWLFGGAEIPVSNALFSLESYKGAIKGDLFGDEQYFTNSAKFWEHQNKAIAAKVEQFKQRWLAAKSLSWMPENIGHPMTRSSAVRSKVAKSMSHVPPMAKSIFMKAGWMKNRPRGRKPSAAKEDGSFEPSERPELTKAAQDYFERHRHGAVRVELLQHPDIALRLMVAHVLCGSSLWKVEPENPVSGSNEQINDSISASKAFEVMAIERKEILKLLDDRG